MSLKPRGSGSRRWGALASALAVACAAASPTPPRPSLPARAQATAPPPAAAADTHGVTLEPLPAPVAGLAPSVEIVQPAPGAVLAPDLAPSTLLKLRVENAALTSDGEGVLVALDGQRPRRVLIGRPLTLAELLPFGASLKAGPHALLAVAVDAQGRTLRAVPGADKAVSVLTFFVGTPPAPQGSTPTSTPRSVFCLSPVGTAYINPGDALVFEVLAFGGAEPSRVRVRTRHFDFELPFDAKRAFALRGLPPGDARLSVGGEPSSECVVTLNAAPEARP